MKSLFPERFTLSRTFREDRHTKTFLANDDLLDLENVIVKLVSKDRVQLSREQLTQHFSWEIGVRHRQFAAVFDAGLTRQGHAFYVREYLQPSELCSTDPLSVMKSLVAAVDFLFRNRRVHGAIKPSNLFVTSEICKLADPQFFSIKINDEEECVHFAAPEVLKGGDTSCEGDLYSLGAVLYNIFTGRHLFEDPDVSRLRSKYVSATPQPASEWSPIPQYLARLILELLSRSPEKRPVAFERLKSAIGSEFILPERAHFVGRKDVLSQAIECAKRPTSLRALIIEGEVGAGKSRFLSEVRLHCGFQGSTFLAWHCTEDSSELSPVKSGIHKLLRSGVYPVQPGTIGSIERTTPEFMRYCAALRDGLSADNSHPIEKLVSEAVGLIGALARRVPLVLGIDDIHWADPETILFLEQLAFRGSEAPLSLILTTEPNLIEPKWIDTMEACLGGACLRLRLPKLSDEEAETLIECLENDRERQVRLRYLASGNPLFIQTYAKLSRPTEAPPEQLKTVVESMLSKLTKDATAALEVLSVFRRPVQTAILARLCKQDVADVESSLGVAERLGLVIRMADEVGIRYTLVRDRLYAGLGTDTKMRLNRDAFGALRERNLDPEALSHHAFEAEMFAEAAILYRDLARNAYEARKYGAAIGFYDRLQRCHDNSADICGASDTFNLARCYEKVGKQILSGPLYRELLTAEEVRADPTLMSMVYTRLAMTDESSPAERSRLLGLALDCLPSSSSHLPRYVAICNHLANLGDLSRASEVFERMEAYIRWDNLDPSILNANRANLLRIKGDFLGATQYHLLCWNDDSPIIRNCIQQGPLLNNLAGCFEQLGDLKAALHYQLLAQEFGVATGDVAVQILSLNNIAAMKTKLGDMREAEYLFGKARTRVSALKGENSILSDVLAAPVQADSAIHAVYRGEYALAEDCVKNLHSQGSQFELDRMLGEVIRCKYFIEICLTDKVVQLLRKLRRLYISGIDFFRVEFALLEARLPDISLKDRIEGLENALLLSQNLGTLYQHCEVLLSLAYVLLESLEYQRAEQYARRALEMANDKDYKLLATRALLLCGRSSQSPREKQHFLYDAFQLASEMGLQELIAESAYYIGTVNMELGNTVTAREYLIRSTSLSRRLSDGVPMAARTKYLAQEWRRDAICALERCNEAMPLHSSVLFVDDGERYFAAIYMFTMAAAAVSSVDSLLAAIGKVLVTSSSRSAVIALKTPKTFHATPIRIKLSPELTEHVEQIQRDVKNRVYFESPDEKGRQFTAWIPLKSETCEGGIYVLCRPYDSPFTEKEIELLTMIGSIASSALKRLETCHAGESEPQDIAEFHGMIGASKTVQDVYAKIRMAAGNAATVLIEGESGTGKELVAKAIHAAGPRAKEPFIPVDCGALPETLIEAELFGAKKGSYTGAMTDRPGLFESAHRGTLFLDEISNTTLTLQAKLLRVIQEREVRRIGETKGRSIDVRVIVASNKSLDALAEAGEFRKDLLYRLKVLHIKVPPLRSRQDDIPMLAHTFLQRLNAANQTKKYFAPGVVNDLSRQQFPGNIRELQNAIERAFFSTNGIMITEAPLDDQTLPTRESMDQVQKWFREIAEGRTDFWSAIHNPYKCRDIPREKVIAFVDFGLRSAQGSYAKMASMLRLNRKEYRRCMDFLRRSDCLLDFRPYRRNNG